MSQTQNPLTPVSYTHLIMVFNTEVLFQMLDNLFKGVNFLIWMVGIGTLLALSLIHI